MRFVPSLPLTGVLQLGLLLACAGAGSNAPPAPDALAADAAPVVGGAPGGPAAPAAPIAPADLAWLEPAVAEALAWEVMPGTTDEPDPARADALRAFFLAHPEYGDPARREALAAEACGLGGTEAAHAWLRAPPPREPLVVDVTDEDWKVFVAHAAHHCTSDDWTWYTAEASQEATARGAATAYGTPTHDALVVRRGDVEVARVPLAGQGFLAARAGRDPKPIAYAPTPEVLPELDAYLGPAR